MCHPLRGVHHTDVLRSPNRTVFRVTYGLHASSHSMLPHASPSPTIVLTATSVPRQKPACLEWGMLGQHGHWAWRTAVQPSGFSDPAASTYSHVYRTHLSALVAHVAPTLVHTPKGPFPKELSKLDLL